MEISKLQELFTNWILSTPMPPPAPSISPLTTTGIKKPATLLPTTRKVCVPTTIPVIPFPPKNTQTPRVTPPPSMTAPDEPVAHHTRSWQRIEDLSASNCTYLYKFLENWASSEVLHPTKALTVLDTDSANSLEHHQLRSHPCSGPTWTTS